MSQANRLGHRLRHSGLADPADRGRLEGLLEDCFAVLVDAQSVMQAELPDISFTPRLKTVDTILDKLSREPAMALSRMRDIAGIRIVEEMNRAEQDVLVRRVRDALGSGRVVDRRATPSFGYRAVHLEHQRRGVYVEVQVRTGLQDQWAQIVERLGDSWGRQVRYGGSPPDADREIRDSFTRSDLWQLAMDLSDRIDEVEVAELDHLRGPAHADDEYLPATARRELAELLLRMFNVVASDWV